MDNFYNSPYVAKLLKTVHKTDCVSALKLNQQKCSKKMKETELEKGEIIAQHFVPVSATEWNEKYRCYDLHIPQS
jgi:hypothetical protein